MKIWGCWAILVTAAGCGGRNFQRPSEGFLVPGTTTRTEVLESMGPPFRESSVTKNGKTLRVITYSYVRIGGLGDSHVTNVMPSRSMSFSFSEDRLVGSNFTSSFEADHTDFNVAAVSRIVKGTTRRSELTPLLGRPGGRTFPPLVEEGHEGWIWQYLHAHPQQHYSKTLVVTVGPNDLVTGVTFTEEGKR